MALLTDNLYNATDIYDLEFENSTMFTSISSLQKSNSALDDAARVIRFVGYWELVVAVIGTPANALVLYLTLTFLKRGSRRPAAATSDRRHQSNLWFIFSMTLSDGLFASVHAPMMFAQYAFGVKYRAEACLTLYIVTHASTICSSLSLLWLNVDKFLYLNQPLHYQTRVTSRRALVAVVCAWVTSVVWALFFMLGPFTTYTPPCLFSPADMYWYTAFAVIFFVLPTVVSLTVSVYIAGVVFRVMRENEARRRTGSVLCNGTSSQGQRSTSGNVKTIAFVFTTTMWSAATYLPYRIAYLLYFTIPFLKRSWMLRLSYFLFALMAANAAGNPFITIFTQRQYSLGFMALIRKREYANTYSTTEGNSCQRRRSSQNPRMASIKRCSTVRRKSDDTKENGQAHSRF